jgi:hypothetical protein
VYSRPWNSIVHDLFSNARHATALFDKERHAESRLRYIADVINFDWQGLVDGLLYAYGSGFRFYLLFPENDHFAVSYVSITLFDVQSNKWQGEK